MFRKYWRVGIGGRHRGQVQGEYREVVHVVNGIKKEQ